MFLSKGAFFLDKAVAVGNMKHLQDKDPETAVDKATDKLEEEMSWKRWRTRRWTRW